MNGKKARGIRKSLGMSIENHRQKEYKVAKQVVKPVYFRDKYGQLLPPELVTKKVIVNGNLYYYRKVKKEITRGRYNNG